MRRDIARLDQLPEGIDAHHIKMLFGICLAELLLKIGLSLPVLQQNFLDLGDHFEASSGAFCLHLIADHLHHFSIAHHLQNLLSDEDLIVFEVDVAPR